MSTFGGDDDLTIHARVDNDASPELRDIKDELKGVEVQADRTGRTASRSSRGFHIMGKAAKVAAFGAKLAFGAALAGGYALTRLLRSSFAEAREAQKVGAATVAIIKATGGAAKVTVGHVGRLATRLSKMAGIDDELIQSGANLLLTFKQVRNEAGRGNRIFDRATKAAVNLSAAGFGSIHSASVMLGKALNDPLKGITALGRAGVTFTQGQKDTIAKMVKANDLLGAQKIILGEVDAQVGGVAKSQATWGDKAQVVFGNIEERLGTALLPLLDDLGRWFVQTGGPQLDRYVGIFERRGVPAIQRFADEVRPLAREYLPEMWDVLKSVFGTVKDMAPYVGDLLKGFNDLPAWAKSAILIGAGGVAAARKVNSGPAGLLGSIASKARPLPVFVVNGGVGGVLGGGKGKGGTVVAGGAGKPGGKLGGKFAAPGAAGVALTALSFNSDAQQIMANPFGELKAEALWPWTEGPFSEKKTKDAEQATARSSKALRNLLVTPLGPGARSHELDELLGGATRQSDKLASSLGKVGQQKPAPKVTTPGMGEALNSTDQLLGLLTGVARTNPRPTISVQGVAAAQTAIASVQSALNSFTGFFGGSSSTDWSGLAGPKRKHREHGGRVLPGQRYIVGEKRPEEFVPDRPGRIMPRVSAGAGAGGGVSIGQVIVHAEGAASDVDVQDAVTRALDEYFRDRDERR